MENIGNINNCNLCKCLFPIYEIKHGDKCDKCKFIQWELLQDYAKRFWTNFYYNQYIKRKNVHENQSL